LSGSWRSSAFIRELEFRRVRLQLDQAATRARRRLLKMHANKREEIKDVMAGDIAAPWAFAM
jgi:hypothetical protein